MPKLGVNIDHVATLRQQRRSAFPDLLLAAEICEAAGADSIVAHLREDRRHIQDADAEALRKTVRTRFNLEMSIAPDIVKIASRLRPDQATLVPEKRQELTTEGGLDVLKGQRKISKAIASLLKNGIDVSLFIEPDKRQITAAHRLGARIVELHTGRYTDSKSSKERGLCLAKLEDAASFAQGLGLEVNAGHGLDYVNVGPVAKIRGLSELNIGYSIVCYAVFAGLQRAVRRMKELIG